MKAGSLGIGTSIVSRAGPALSVTNVTWHRNQSAELAAGSVGSSVGGYVVYNLTVEDDHTFFVGTAGGGTWVHNVDCGGAELSDETTENIFRKHGSDSTMYDKGKFNPGTSPGDLQDMITQTVTKGNPMLNTEGRDGLTYDYDFNGLRPTGTLVNGQPAGSLRVVVDSGGGVVTAFPIP